MFVKVVDILQNSCNKIPVIRWFCINIKSTCNNWLKFETYTDNRIQMQILRAKLQENMYLLIILDPTADADTSVDACLIYRWRLPIKSFRKTTRNRISFYYRTPLVAHTLENSLACARPVLLPDRSLVNHWLPLQMECLGIIIAK